MKIEFEKKCIYNKLLFLLIFFLPFSDKLNLIDFGFVHVFAFRVVLVLSFIYLLINKKIKLIWIYQAKWLLLFVSFLILYGSISVLFVESKELAIKQLFYLISAAITIVVLYSLLKITKKPIKIFSEAWLFSFIIMAFFGFLEIITNAHFLSGYTTHLESFDFIRPSFNAPLVSYTNPNDFSIFLCFSIVIFINYYLEYKKNVAIIAIIVAYLLLYNTLSRYGLTAIYLLLFFFIILTSYRTHWSWFKKYNWKILGYTASFLFIISYIIITNPIGKPIEENGKVKIVDVPLTWNGFDFLFSTSTLPKDSTGSVSVRKNLILNGLQFTIQSKGMGIGAGQFEYKMENDKNVLFTNHVNSPHHFVIEILSQYGLIAFVLLMLIFLSILITMIKLVKTSHQFAISNNFILLASLIIVYSLTSNSASSYIPHALNWVILTLIMYVFNEIKEVNLIKE